MADNRTASGAAASTTEGFDALYEAERQKMLRLAVLIVGSRALAEEVVQDAFVTIHERWDSLDRPGGYLRAVVVNNCRMLLRRQIVESKHPNPIHFSSQQGDSHDTAEIPELRDALRVLSDDQRSAIVLRYFCDLTDSVIAETLDCRPSTVRSHLRRGLRRLRQELK